MNGACLFSLGPATAKDYIKAEISAKFQPVETKVNPARNSYRVYNHTVHK